MGKVFPAKGFVSASASMSSVGTSDAIDDKEVAHVYVSSTGQSDTSFLLVIFSGTHRRHGLVIFSNRNRTDFIALREK